MVLLKMNQAYSLLRWFLAPARDYCLLWNVYRRASWVHPATCLMGIWDRFWIAERLERDVDHLSPSSAEFNKWSCASNPRTCLNVVAHGQLYCSVLRCFAMLSSVYW